MSLRYELICDGAVRRYPDGREVCRSTAKGRVEYKRRTLEMARRQQAVCGICHDPLRLMLDGNWNAASQVTFHHADGRGMGGARRNDSIAPETGNCAAHWDCNGKQGSRRA